MSYRSRKAIRTKIIVDDTVETRVDAGLLGVKVIKEAACQCCQGLQIYRCRYCILAHEGKHDIRKRGGSISTENGESRSGICSRGMIRPF
jgi:hypothetical protein